jgi:prevent-host-death family protein
MKDTWTIEEAQTRLPHVVKRAEQGGLPGITRRGKTTAYVIGADRFGALIETMELLANPKAMKALRDAKAGRTRYLPLEKLPD